MKYIMLQIKTGGVSQRIPVLFPDALVHAEVAEALLKHIPTLKKAKTINAGTVKVHASVDEASESTTLELKAGSDDSMIINTHDFFHGIL